MQKLKIMVFMAIFGLTVFVSGYVYLNSRLEQRDVLENISSIPYYSVPQNACILMNICKDSVLLYLDFSEESINIVFPEDNVQNYGYTVNYTYNCDYETVGYLVDFVGGINLEDYRYTGVQITNMLEFSITSADTKKAITEEIINGMAEVGFTKEALLYLIENGDTDLKFNEGFLWVDYIGKLCRFPRFVN